MTKKIVLFYLLAVLFVSFGCTNVGQATKNVQEVSLAKPQVLKTAPVVEGVGVAAREVLSEPNTAVTKSNYQSALPALLKSSYGAEGVAFKETVDAEGKKYAYFSQEYNGVPVYGSRSVALLNDQGMIFLKMSFFRLDMDVTPAVTSDFAVKKAGQDLRMKVHMQSLPQMSTQTRSNQIKVAGGLGLDGYYDISGDWRRFDSSSGLVLIPRSTELVIYPMKDAAYLAYKVEMPLVEDLPAKFTYFIDAKTGNIIDVKNMVVSYDVGGTVTGPVWMDPFTDGIQENFPFGQESVIIGGSGTFTDDAGSYVLADILPAIQLEEGQTSVVHVGGMAFEVTADFVDVDSGSAMFSINTWFSPDMHPGDEVTVMGAADVRLRLVDVFSWGGVDVVSFVLYGPQEGIILSQGETTLLNIEGVVYEVTSVFADTDAGTAKFSVDGQITPDVPFGDDVSVPGDGGVRLFLRAIFPEDGLVKVSFDLYGPSDKQVLKEGQSDVYSLDEKDYDIAAVFVDVDSGVARFSVDGWISPDMYPGDDVAVPGDSSVHVYVRQVFSHGSDDLVSFDFYGPIADGSGVSLRSGLEGPWVTVLNDQQPVSVHEHTFTGPETHDWNWSDDDASYLQEESNAFYHVNKIHDYAQQLGVDEIDFQMITRVNLASTCNAYYSTEPSINFFQAGNGCESTGVISDVIYHEYGHGIVHALNPSLLEIGGYWDQSGNLHEALADYWACTINDDPGMGDGFFQDDPSPLRVCDSDDRYPEDYYPEPHSGCQIISGALWDLRDVLGPGVIDPKIVLALRLLPLTFEEFAGDLVVVDPAHAVEVCDAFSVHGIVAGECVGHTEDPLGIIVFPVQYKKVNGTVEIIGTAWGSMTEEMTYYTIDYSLDEENWLTEGIVLANGGTVPVAGGVLGTWDTREANDDQGSYKLRLRVYTQTRSTETGNWVTIVNNPIIEPLEFDFLRAGDELEIRGTIQPVDFESYDVQWWDWDVGMMHSDGMLYTGQSPVSEGIIATWDTSVISDPSTYGIEITVHRMGRPDEKIYKYVYLDPAIKEGWPIKFDSPIQEANPEYTIWVGNVDSLAVDLDRDGETEIIFPMAGNEITLHVLRPDGTYLPGWPVTLPSVDFWGVPGGNLPSPVVSDIDNDGFDEIVILNPLGDNKLYAFNVDASLVEGFPTDLHWTVWDSGYESPVGTAQLSIGDLDNDGKKEIVVLAVDPYILTVYANNGTQLNTSAYHWPVDYLGEGGDPVISTGGRHPIIANFDSDPELEIAFGSMEVVDDVFLAKVFVYNYDGTSFGSPWPAVQEDDLFFKAPAFGDVDADGKNELVVGFHRGQVFVYDAQGDIPYSWPGMVIANIAAPALADASGDGFLEVLISQYCWGGCDTYLFDYQGDILQQFHKGFNGHWYGTNSKSALAIRDATDNVNVLDVGGDNFYAWKDTGEAIRGFPKQSGNLGMGSFGFSAVDIDRDGRIELVGGAEYPSLEDGEGGWIPGFTKMFVWETDIVPYFSDWETYSHDPARTGLYEARGGGSSPLLFKGSSPVLRKEDSSQAPLGRDLP